MKHLLVADESGTPLYFDRDDGQILCPLLMAFQLFVNNYFGESARAVTTLGNSGTPGMQVALQIHGRLYFVALSDQGESAAELDTELQLIHDLLKGVVGPRAFDPSKQGITLWQTKQHHMSFLRLADTGLELCERHPNVLVRSLEQIEANASIRMACARCLQAEYSQLPEFRAGVIYVGTRLLTHYLPGDVLSEGKPHSLSQSGDFTAYDAFLLMLYVQSLFRPAEGKRSPTGARSPAAQPPEDGNSGQMAVPLDALSMSSRMGLSGSSRRSYDGSSNSLSRSTSRPRAKPVAEVEGVSTSPDGGLLSAGWLPPELQKSAKVGLFYLSSGLAHIIYCAEVLPDIFLVVALRQSNKRLIDQRKGLAKAHVNCRELLARDYAGYLLTKGLANVPMLGYASRVPGVVHFIFVDRMRNIAIAPSLAPLYGQAAEPSHTAKDMKRLVYRLVQLSHAHLAHGYTTMVVRADGFQFAYHMALDAPGSSGGTENGDFSALVKKFGQMPWIVSPRLYADLISMFKSTYCYELYSIYLGVLSPSSIAYKNAQLLKALASSLGQQLPK